MRGYVLYDKDQKVVSKIATRKNDDDSVRKLIQSMDPKPTDYMYRIGDCVLIKFSPIDSRVLTVEKFKKQ